MCQCDSSLLFIFLTNEPFICFVELLTIAHDKSRYTQIELNIQYDDNDTLVIK